MSSDSAQVAVGKEASVVLDALPGRVFHGSVVRLAPFFDPTTRTLDAEVQLANTDGTLRPGMYGRGSITLERHPGATVLPAAAMQMSDQQRYVFVLEGNRVRRKLVETGYDAGEWLEVKSGVLAGEQVVIAGADGLSEGSVVRVASEAPRVAGASQDTPSGLVLPHRWPLPHLPASTAEHPIYPPCGLLGSLSRIPSSS